MGCICSIARQINSDIDIRKDREIKVNLKTNNIINHNKDKEKEKEKEDIIIETKIPETTDIDHDKNNKLKKNEEKNINSEKKEEKEEKGQISDNNDIIEKEIRTKNHYNQKVFELINQIRLNPSEYYQTILDNINFIIKETHGVVNKETGIVENKEIFVFKKKVKVNLYRGEEGFREAAEALKNTSPMEKFIFNKDIVIPLPDKEEDIIDSTFIKNKANEIRLHSNINVYFKEYIKNPEIAVLLMIVDDTEVMSGKKRECLLNPNFKYIGIDSKFIGKNFIAHFSFSK